MRENLNPARFANAVLIDTLHPGSFLLLEGVSDGLLFKKLIEPAICKIIVCHSKANVINAITILNDHKNNNHLGIVDKDFSEILNNLEKIDNLLYSDYHDIETFVFTSRAFDVIIDLHATPGKLDTFKEKNGHDLRTFYLNAIKPYSLLKLTNHVYNLGLAFKPPKLEDAALDISKFINDKDLAFEGVDKMILIVHSFTSKYHDISIKTNEIRKHYDEVGQTEYPQLQLANGHDLNAVIHLSLRKLIGSYNSKDLLLKELENQLILSHDTSCFKTSDLYMNIKNWEHLKQKKVLFF